MEHFDQLLNVKTVANLIGISVSSVWEWSRTNKLPSPIKITAGSTRWRKSEIEAFIRGEWNRANNE